MWWSYLIEMFFSLGLLINAVLFVPLSVDIFQKKSSQEYSFFKYFGLLIFQFFAMLHGYFTNDLTMALGFLLSTLSCLTLTVMITLFRA